MSELDLSRMVVTAGPEQYRMRVEIHHPFPEMECSYWEYLDWLRDVQGDPDTTGVNLKMAHHLLPKETTMGIKFGFGDIMIIQQVQTAWKIRRQGYATAMLAAAVERRLADGHRIFAVRIESPNLNSMRWWDGRATRMMRERFPDILVEAIDAETRAFVKAQPLGASLAF